MPAWDTRRIVDAAGTTWTGCTTTSPTRCCSPARSPRRWRRSTDGERDALELLHAAGLSARRVDRHDQDRGRARVLRVPTRSTRPGTRTCGCCSRPRPTRRERIRFGPNVTHVFLREPTLICQQVATLDELTGGRTELVVSTGNFGLLAQYGIDWASQKPLSRLKEAIHVMRTFLADGAITFEGDFFKYNGLYTFARPVQEHIPIKMGGMKGPRSFQAAGEIAEGLHHALSYSREAYDYMTENVRIGAEKAGRDWRRARPRRVGRDRRLRRLRRRQARGAHPRRVLHLLDARRAARAPRHRRGRAGAGGRGARRGRHPEGGRAVQARVRREALDRRHAGGGRGEDQDRHPADRASTT